MAISRRELLAWALTSLLTGCALDETASDSLATPFAAAGDPARGREVFVAREGGHCVLCHAAPGVGTAGDVGPSLAGVGSRFTEGQLRLRVADITLVKPDAAMPSFHRLDGLTRVAPEYRDRPVLDGQQVEDVVAFLATLR
jgi:sulfur-oxidizing protein SoxX